MIDFKADVYVWQKALEMVRHYRLVFARHDTLLFVQHKTLVLTLASKGGSECQLPTQN